MLVGVPQAAGSLADQIAGQGNGQRALIDHELLEVLARHVLHDQVAKPLAGAARKLDLARVKGQHDVGMAQHGQRLHLAAEALQEDGVVIVLRDKDLDGDRPFHVDMLGLVNRAHPSGADPVQHPVIAQHQSKGLPGQDALQLEAVEQALLNQFLRQQRGLVLTVGLTLRQELVQILGVDQPRFRQLVEELGERREIPSSGRR